MRILVRTFGVPALVWFYIILYILNVERCIFTHWVGPLKSVYVDYRVCHDVSSWAFYPLHVLDSQLFRPAYWERYPEKDPLLGDRPVDKE